MEIYARQGDLVIRKLDSSEVEQGNLKEEQNPVLAGSDTSTHTIPGKHLVRRDNDRIIVQIAETVQMIHGDRHRPVELAPGSYQITSLRERRDGQDRDVED